MKIILHSACDDGYVPLLLEMMESLESQLAKYDFGLLDLGLSDASKDKIRKLKPDIIIKEPKWFIELPPHLHNPFSQATASRPFMKEIFPNYDGYMQIDADLWFLDSSAVDDYIKAGKSSGFAISTEAHNSTVPRYFENSYLPAKYMNIYLWKAKKQPPINSWAFNRIRYYFGIEEAMKFGFEVPKNAGLYFLHATSPVWRQWQEVMKSVNWYNFKNERDVCDQTCLFYAMYKYTLPCSLLSIHHNWVSHTKTFLLDKKTGKLIDPVYPHKPIKVLHFVCKEEKKAHDIGTTDGGSVNIKLTRTEFLKATQ